MSVRNRLPFAVVPEWLVLAPISDRAVRLYALLVRHADRDGHAHPARRRLAKLLRCSERTLDRAMGELVAVGALEIHRQRTEAGDWGVNEYVLRPQGPDSGAPRGVTDDPTGGVTDGPMNESQYERENYYPSPCSPPPDTAAAFAEFWAIYPRRVGKRKALEAFARALRRAPAEEILAGARRYRDDPNREDAYTAHPTTWLNRDGWQDDPLPPRRAGPAPVHPVDQAMELARAMRVSGEARAGGGAGGADLRGLPRP